MLNNEQFVIVLIFIIIIEDTLMKGYSTYYYHPHDDLNNSHYPGYTWWHLVDADLSCHMVLGSTSRFLPHTVKSFYSYFHTNKMAGNHSDEISINEITSIKKDLV